jgi:hypothetical protein
MKLSKVNCLLSGALRSLWPSASAVPAPMAGAAGAARSAPIGCGVSATAALWRAAFCGAW